MDDFVREAVEETLKVDAETVREWQAGTAKTWGFLAGRAVGRARRSLGRDLTDGERRAVWSALWGRLQALQVAEDVP